MKKNRKKSLKLVAHEREATRAKHAKLKSAEREAAKLQRTEKKSSAKPATDASPWLARWKAGEQISVLAAEAGFKRSKFRRMLIAAAGGKTQFRELRSTGAGGTTKPFGGKRAAPGPRAKPDDTSVKKVVSSKRWQLVRHWAPRNVTIKGGAADGSNASVTARECVLTEYISPSGNSYVRAFDSEPADLLVDIRVPGVPPIRLKRYDASKLAKKHEQSKVELDRGMKALDRMTKRKRAARQQRKARRSA